MFLQDNNCVIDNKPCEIGNLYCSLECQLKDAANENLDLSNSVAATHYPQQKQKDDLVFNQITNDEDEEDDSLFSLDDLSAYYYCTECNDSHLKNHNCTMMNTHKSSLPSLSSSNSSISYNLNSNFSQYTSPQLTPENSNNYTYQQQQPILINNSYTGNGSNSPSEWVYNLPVKQAALNKLQQGQEEWGLDLNLSSNSSYQLRDGSILNSLIDYTKDFESSKDSSSKYSLQNARNNYQLWLENNNMY
ncbi:hypothetical protein B5S31_g3035 [[Candida] boidinii]|uniref:Unnamed protein product n=1 Tax=Candida boidinii TaxID=5477 RepID=A0ACB5TRA4_CANBO|nr:hypothetical protein B5S29_g3894 [[Candida] boidinii]OWB73297.1 hypothetical protein B5S31_g3035 [[Candida] boidinii]OWB79241.1 hypothetical protein B5S32_g3456 [[Candida] boidinii]GME93258.1 unnamed protein product [[Candida] boidinii]GME95747.1 unnamed protein product [[Candida] boidinii]